MNISIPNTCNYFSFGHVTMTEVGLLCDQCNHAVNIIYQHTNITCWECPNCGNYGVR